MSELTVGAVAREKVCALQREMLKLPQAEPITREYRAGGMYVREVERPKGMLIVGKVHRKEHLYIVTKGRVRVTTDTGMRDLEAGAVLVCQPGTKRAVLALEDSICLTVHRVDSESTEDIERELVEVDATSLFGPGNKLKALA